MRYGFHVVSRGSKQIGEKGIHGPKTLLRILFLVIRFSRIDRVSLPIVFGTETFSSQDIDLEDSYAVCFKLSVIRSFF
jgi:hypothetical protein